MPLPFTHVSFEAAYGVASQLPATGHHMEVAFAGRSNVGKSSLLNKLFNRKSLARVSSVPGKTATINFYRMAGDVRLVDLPGYGYARVSKNEKRRYSDLIGGYFEQDRNIVLIVLLIDSRHAPSKDDINMIEFLVEAEYPFLIAFTKSDKLSNRQIKERMEGFKEEIPYFEDIVTVTTSAETGAGIERLKELISDVTGYTD